MGCEASVPAATSRKSSFRLQDHNSKEKYATAESKKGKSTLQRNIRVQFEDLVKTVEQLCAVPHQIVDNDYISQEMKHALSQLDQFITALRENQCAKHEKFTLQLADLLVNQGFFAICCDIVISLLTTGYKNVDGTSNSQKYEPLHCSLQIVVNVTDYSEKMSVAVANHPEFLKTLKIVIRNASARFKTSDENAALQNSVVSDYEQSREIGKNDEESVKNVSENKVVETAQNGKAADTWINEDDDILLKCVSIVSNVSMFETNIPILRGLDFTNVFKPYLNSREKDHRVFALMALSGIVNEDESAIINANPKQVQMCLAILEEGLKSKERCYEGYTCREMCQAVKQLARNDANKKLLIDSGALKLLLLCATTGNEPEQYECIAAVWALCFDKAAHLIDDPKLRLVETIVKFCRSKSTRISKMSTGALWAILNPVQEQLYDIHDIQKDWEDDKASPYSNNDDFGVQQIETKSLDDLRHVFISYCWGNQKMVLRIRDCVEKGGLKVCMDMEGSVLEVMAKGIENGAVFLMCMSHKYKNSQSCRTEAEYAIQSCKRIIPLRIESDYQPDGWLGRIASTKRVFDFTGQNPVEENVSALINVIRAAAYDDLNTIENQQSL